MQHGAKPRRCGKYNSGVGWAARAAFDISAKKKGRTDLGHDAHTGQHTDELLQVGGTSEKKRSTKEWMGSERVVKLLYNDCVAMAAAEARGRV